MVEVFKTNIRDKMTAHLMTAHLQKHFPGGKINFDLDDCDNILRVEYENVCPEKIALILSSKGYTCEVLE
jgi:hypothetical protein